MSSDSGKKRFDSVPACLPVVTCQAVTGPIVVHELGPVAGLAGDLRDDLGVEASDHRRIAQHVAQRLEEEIGTRLVAGGHEWIIRATGANGFGPL